MSGFQNKSFRGDWFPNFETSRSEVAKPYYLVQGWKYPYGLEKNENKNRDGPWVYEPCGSTLHDLYWAITNNS